MPAPTHGRGWLQDDVRKVCDDYVTGALTLAEGKKLTPHTVAKVIGDRRKETAPSTGAVAAVFQRWQEFGFALFHDKPFSFKDYTAKGKKQGREGIMTERSEQRKKARAAAKPAKPAKTAAKKAPVKVAAKKAPAKAKKAPAKSAA